MKLNGKKGENNHTVQHELYITGGIILLFVTIHFFNAFFNLELKFYDFMLRIKPDTPQNPAVLFVNIDDLALERLGAWPWSRDIIADALIRMRELGAAKAVFDIEYLSPSRLGINPEAAENLPQEFGALKDDLAQQINELTGAVGRGMLPPEYLPEAGEELVSYMDPLFDGLYDTVVSGLFRDNDRYFGEAIRFFGNAYLTINAARVNSSQDTELEAFAAEKFMLHPGDVSDPQGNIAAETVSFYRSQNMTAGITPAIYPVLEHARGAGFTNVILDGDGTLRRIGLLYEYQGNYVCQLVLSPLLDLLDTRSISRSGSRLTIRDALFPGESERRDISIPLDRDGTMYINWTRAQFDSSFRQESLYFLYYIDEVERNLLSAIRSLSSVRVRGNDGLHLSYFRAAEYLLASYDELGRRKARLLDGTDTDFNGYFAARKQFFEEVPFLLKPEMEEEALSRLTELSSLPEAATAAEHIGNAFNVIRSEYDLYRETFAELLSAYGGSFCILGNSATATTDLGTTPFHGSYPNVATHANVFNTIFLGEFIIPVSSWAGFAVAAALALIWTALGRRRAILFRNVSGGCGVLFFPLLFFSLFLGLRIYVPFLTSAVMLFSVFFVQTAFRFALSEKDKRFLRYAFSTYLSSDLVNEIVADPAKLSLGGEEKRITALFSDIKGFSTLSEMVTPEQLVSILNEYLTLLSNRILDNSGTIDKYIGDAIVAFFGAPLTVPDHAWRACVSAIRMKQAEGELNKTLLESGKSPLSLVTRIGLNTGDMVVGNMGTEMKMNYTMMGNEVNLAARLEGVNKVYGTGILASESTWNEADSGEHSGLLLGRRLDMVRVVGIEKPVQVYHILGLRDELSRQRIEMTEQFHGALEFYLRGEFGKARTGFMDILRLCPDDGAVKVFAERCVQFLRSGTPDDWDGVINMTNK